VLRVSVLGRMGVARDGVELPAPASRRAWSLLAYLALRPGPQSRGELAARFWPDVLDSSARASLRSAVWSLRKALGPGAEEILIAGRDDVALSDAELWVDARAFTELIEQGRDNDAVALCDGELLSGFEDEWISSAREAHREQLLKALERLACECEQAGNTDSAIEWSRRQVASDPFGEEAHRRLIARLAQSGDRAAALLAYRSLADRLRRELSVAPSLLTRQLVEDLREEPAAALALPDLANLLPLVGRSHDLDRLGRAWRLATDGRGGVVTLTGEAGIGKTRLACELLALAARDGAATASCAALDLGGAAPFGMWAELIREMLPALPSPPPGTVWPDDLARLVPDIHARFEREPAERAPASPELERARLLEAVVALVEWAARTRPLALLLEDLHISDGASLELTGYIARRVASLPVLLVLTRRERPRRVEADTLENALRARGLLHAELSLGPLAPTYLADLARSAAHLEDGDVERVVDASEGNALLAVEMARALARGERELSAGLRGAVAGAFGALGATAQGFVEIAAVAARELDSSEIAALPIDEPAQAATEALESGMFIARERRIGFRHALLREAVYTEIPEPRRVSLHETWAQILLANTHVESQRSAELARHLRLAGRDSEAVEQLALAAGEARAVAALQEAAGYLREAVSIAPKRADLLLELAEVEAWHGRRAEAEEAFATAIDLLDDASALERTHAWLRSARWYHGPICVPALVRECCAKALAELDTVASPAKLERREALAALAWAEAVAGSVDEAERLLAELHRLTADEPVDDLSTYDVAHARALAAVRREDFEGSYAPSIAAGEAIARAGRPDLAYGCWANAAGAAAAAGDLDRAMRFLDRLDDILAGKGLAPLEIQLLAMRSFLLMRVGDLDGARVAADSAATIAERIDDRQLIAATAHDRGMVALAEDDAALAATLLEAALIDGAPISPAVTRLARAEALARLGRLDEAEAEVRATALEPLRPSDWPETLVPRLARVQGLIAWRAGDLALAARRLQEAADGWGRQLSRLSRGERMAAVLADLGRPVVGLIEPDRELERVQSELDLLQKNDQGVTHAVLS
jgi:DNA-binding SARP family transcriptional activator/tetratricopeptide (TPR) repeat protein